MADSFNVPITALKHRLPKVQRRQAASPLVIITTVCVGALLIVALLIYVGVFATRRGEHAPTSADSSLTKAVQVWKDETAMLGRMRVSRMMADDRNNFAEVHQLDAEIEAQEAKVDRARQRKDLLDR
jgi:hypothetical protein